MPLVLNTSNPFQIIFTGMEPGLIVNRDPMNQVLIGPTQGSLFFNNPETNIINPLSAINYDGTTDVWGIALAGTPPVDIIAGTTNAYVSTGVGPTPAPPKITFNSVGSGGTVDLVTPTATQQIQLRRILLSSFVAANAPSAFNVQDLVQDNKGNTYFGLQVGLPSSGGIVALAPVLEFNDIVLPVGAKLQLVNGGGAGALHQLAATVMYFLLGS